MRIIGLGSNEADEAGDAPAPTAVVNGFKFEAEFVKGAVRPNDEKEKGFIIKLLFALLKLKPLFKELYPADDEPILAPDCGEFMPVDRN